MKTKLGGILTSMRVTFDVHRGLVEPIPNYMDPVEVTPTINKILSKLVPLISYIYVKVGPRRP